MSRLNMQILGLALLFLIHFGQSTKTPRSLDKNLRNLVLLDWNGNILETQSKRLIPSSSHRTKILANGLKRGSKAQGSGQRNQHQFTKFSIGYPFSRFKKVRTSGESPRKILFQKKPTRLNIEPHLDHFTLHFSSQGDQKHQEPHHKKNGKEYQSPLRNILSLLLDPGEKVRTEIIPGEKGRRPQPLESPKEVLLV